MNARTSYLRPLAAVVAVGVALTLSSCSEDPEPKEASSNADSAGSDEGADSAEDVASDGDVEAFCDDATAVTDGSFFEGLGDPASDDPADAYDSALESIDAIEPPAEIADEWYELTDAMAVMFEGMAGLDYTSETAVDDMLELTESMDTESIHAASSTVETFVEEHCEAAAK